MEEQTQEHTYAYETSQDSDELMKIKKQELKDLKKKAKRDKKVRLANKAKMRVIRDDKIDRISLKLKTIKENMVYYNRAGKKEKDGIDILGIIYESIKKDVGLREEIERGKNKLENYIDPDEYCKEEPVGDEEIEVLGIEHG